MEFESVVLTNIYHLGDMEKPVGGSGGRVNQGYVPTCSTCETNRRLCQGNCDRHQQQSENTDGGHKEGGHKDGGYTKQQEADKEKGNSYEDTHPKVYWKRWVMLALFCFYSFSNSFQWIHLSIIANVVERYYNQSLPEDTYERTNAIDWLSMIYMLSYIPLIFPATWLLDKKGLRFVCVIGSLLNAVGAWMKCGSVSEDRFALLMAAQTVCSVAQIFVLGIPTRLAAVWFGPNEVSTATSIGVFGNQVGVAVGFILPPILIPNTDNFESLNWGFHVMFYATAGLTSFVFLLILIFFQDKPEIAPSRAQQIAVEAAANENYMASLKRIIGNRGFNVLNLSYAINIGAYYAISTLLNPIVLAYFPGEEESAGRIGLTIILAGVSGAVLAGIWLDKTKTFKATTIGIYIVSLACMLAFTFTLDLGMLWVVYVTAGAFGFFVTGYLPVGFEFAVELTYPESEGTSSGILNALAQLSGIIFTIAMRAMINSISVFSANIMVCASLLLGTILTAFIKPDYRRQEAGRQLDEKFLNQDFIVEKPINNSNELPQSASNKKF